MATALTAGLAIAFLLIGDPVWIIAAANFTYLIGIALPSVAVWLLRRNEPDLHRPYRAPRGTIILGLSARRPSGASRRSSASSSSACPPCCSGWPGLLRRRCSTPGGGGATAAARASRGVTRSLHVEADRRDAGGAGARRRRLPAGRAATVDRGRPGPDRRCSQDIFVAVAILTITVGLVLPGMIAHAAEQVAEAADRLATGTLADLTKAMEALAAGRLDAAHARVD